jgi:hypothetical protein
MLGQDLENEGSSGESLLRVRFLDLPMAEGARIPQFCNTGTMMPSKLGQEEKNMVAAYIAGAMYPATTIVRPRGIL